MPLSRRTLALQTRTDAAHAAASTPPVIHRSNGDERRFPFHVATFTKGLPHHDDQTADDFGEVDEAAFGTLVTALTTRSSVDYEAVALTPGGRRLVNPQAGLAFDLEGTDPQALTMTPAPRLDGDEATAEIIELYWMALCRDVAFRDYDTDPLVAAAAADLAALGGYAALLPLTPATVFRGFTAGDRTGPYLSQFLLHDFAYGTLRVSGRQETVRPGTDHVTQIGEWVQVQNGETRDPNPPAERDGTLRYLRNLRDAAHYVHFDQLFQAYLDAALALLEIGAPFDAGNPYRRSRTQEGFGTFGGAHLLSLVTEVATRAVKAQWYQKWYVHQRLRPEAYGGLIHLERQRVASGRPRRYPLIPDAVLTADVVDRTESRFHSALLPLAFPEGSPLHPAYGSGHATVAGACVTVLKAWFDESWPAFGPGRPRAVVQADTDGTSLETVPGVGPLTVGGELDKLAGNIALARNGAGVHWRSDYTEAVRLGEAVALSVLREQLGTYHEASALGFTAFDGTTVAIT